MPPAQGPADYQGLDAPTPEPTASVETFESELAVDRGRAPILTPASMPPPKTGAGRRLLYVVLGLLALMAAGIAGYLLFQLQDDDTTEAGTEAGQAQAVADNGQLGSLSQPHDLAKGIKINYPTDDGDQTWVLEVAEPATVLDAGDGDREVMAKLRLRNESESRSVALSELRFNLVSSDGGAVINVNDGCSAGDDLDTNTALEPGGQAAGALCWTVPEAQAGGSLLGVESTQVLGRVHVSLS